MTDEQKKDERNGDEVRRWKVYLEPRVCMGCGDLDSPDGSEEIVEAVFLTIRDGCLVFGIDIERAGPDVFTTTESSAIVFAKGMWRRVDRLPPGVTT
jgi:hypothetical protein